MTRLRWASARRGKKTETKFETKWADKVDGQSEGQSDGQSEGHGEERLKAKTVQSSKFRVQVQSPAHSPECPVHGPKICDEFLTFDF